MRTDKRLKEIAATIYQGEVFTTDQIHQHELSLLPTIFLPLIFMPKEQMKLLRNAGMLVSVGKPSPRSINGYPCGYGAFEILTKTEAKKVRKYVEAIRKAVASV